MRSWSHRGRYPPEGGRATAVRVAGKQELIIRQDTGRPHLPWVGGLTAPLNSAAENSLLRSHWVLLVSLRTWQGMLSSGPDVDVTMSLLTPAKHKQSFVSPGPCSIEERLLELGG